MSKLDDLIKELCPNGVEYVDLCEITSVLRGKRLTKSNLIENSQYPVFHGGLDPLGYYTESNRTANTVMIINVGASAGTVGFSDVDFWSSDGCYCLDHSSLFLDKYVYYALLCREIDLKSKVRYAGIPTLDSYVIERTKIPLPTLPVQEEIVRILDNFTKLTAELTVELTAELTARKKQYEYYRDSLLTFGDEVEWQKLKNIVVMTRGKRVIKSQLSDENNYPVYQNSMTPLGYHTEFNCHKNTTFIICAGSAGSIGFLDKEFWAADDCTYFKCDEKVNSKYLFYALQCQQEYILSRVRKASVPRLGKDIVENIRIQVPPLSEQQRIVDILDRFDTLCNDITSGLPAEIKMRQQQYEYYRDKLLTFKKFEE